MRLFRRKPNYPEGEHAPATMPATCLGEECPNFTGVPCEDSEYMWWNAKATTNDNRDTSKPPIKDEAIYVHYGRYCLMGSSEQELVGQRVEVYRPNEVNPMLFVAISDRYGEMPFQVAHISQDNIVEASIVTIAKSNPED